MNKVHLTIICMLVFSMILAVTANVPEIKITKPLEGDTVNLTEKVEGTSNNVTDYKKMRLVVFLPSINSYHPQDNRYFAINNFSDGRWLTKAIIGDQYSSGSEFQLLITLADDKADKEILAYLDKSNKARSWPGMDDLPKGTIIYDRVTVIRK